MNMQHKILGVSAIREVIKSWLGDESDEEKLEDQERIDIMTGLDEQEIKVYIRVVKEMQKEMYQILFNSEELLDILIELQQQENFLIQEKEKKELRSLSREVELKAQLEEAVSLEAQLRAQLEERALRETQSELDKQQLRSQLAELTQEMQQIKLAASVAEQHKAPSRSRKTKDESSTL